MMMKRRLDRARIIRARRLWWERNGAFCMGLASGVALSLAGFGMANWLLDGF